MGWGEVAVDGVSELGRRPGGLSPFNKPVLIAETAAKPDMQVGFLSAAALTLKASFPQVAGFMYFDSAGPMADWRLTTQGSASFATMARDPYMSAQP